MKTKFTRWTLIVQISTLAIFFSCNKEDPQPVFDVPTITITSPTIPEEGLEIEVGQTVDVVLSVSADAGLTSLTANGQSVKSYGGTELTDDVTYQVAPDEAGSFTVDFKVIDAQDSSAVTSLDVVAVDPPVPPFIISDLGGVATGSVTVDVEDQGWDIRVITTFENTSNLSATSATMQFVASQGFAQFAQDNPDESVSDQVLKITGAPETGEGSWGGHYIFAMIGLGEMIPTTELEALPQIEFDGTIDIDGDEEIDASIAKIKEGYTRVIQVDAYYDDTVNPDLSLNDLKQTDPIYGLDLTRGYQIDLALVNSALHMDITTGEVQGFFTAYSAWIEESNKWVTLTFEVASESNQQFFDDGEGPNSESANPVTIDQVDGVTLIPAYSHQIWGDDLAEMLDGDTNPLYFRNLRIVNITE